MDEKKVKNTWGGRRAGAGKPALPKDEVKKNRSIKMSDKEWDLLGSLADAKHMTKSEYIRFKTLEENKE